MPIFCEIREAFQYLWQVGGTDRCAQCVGILKRCLVRHHVVGEGSVGAVRGRCGGQGLVVRGEDRGSRGWRGRCGRCGRCHRDRLCRVARSRSGYASAQRADEEEQRCSSAHNSVHGAAKRWILHAVTIDRIATTPSDLSTGWCRGVNHARWPAGLDPPVGCVDAPAEDPTQSGQHGLDGRDGDRASLGAWQAWIGRPGRRRKHFFRYSLADFTGLVLVSMTFPRECRWSGVGLNHEQHGS